MIRVFSQFNSPLSAVITSKSWQTLKPAIESSMQAISEFDKGVPVLDDQGFVYSKIKDADKALDVLTEIVTDREPLALALGLGRTEFRKVICNSFLKMSDFTKLSIEVTRDEKPVGVFVALDWKNQNRLKPQTEAEKATWKKFEPLSQFLNKNHLINVVQKGHTAHDITGGVYKEFERLGIATKVLTLKIALAKYHGFEYYISESAFGCSHAHKVFAKFLEFGSEMRFSDYVYEGEKIFSSLEGGYVLLCREIV